MFIDLTYELDKKTIEIFIDSFITKKDFSKFGHFGTHFDVMDKKFPLEYTRRNGVFFDVSLVRNREIEKTDISLNNINEHDFVIFYTGTLQKEGYGTKKYFENHPELSQELIFALVEKKISLIGVDMAGVRRGKEHNIADQYCADSGVFIIENLANLFLLLEATANKSSFIVHTYPLKLRGYTGLPTRIIAEII